MLRFNQVGFLFIFFAHLISCENRNAHLENNVISLANEVGTYSVLNLSDYATDVKYIPLETYDSVLISGIGNLIYEKEKIIILSDWKQNECLVFNNDGSFCNKIGHQGHGPEEYIAISQIFINDDWVYLKTIPTMLMVYSITGEFVKKITRPEKFNAQYLVREIQYLKPGIFFMDVASYETSYYPRTLLIESTNDVTSEIIKEFVEPVKIEKSFAFASDHEFAITYRFKNDIRFYKYTNCDTIFTVGQHLKKKEAFIFDFGKYKTTEDISIQKKSGSDKKPIKPEYILESERHLFIQFNFAKHAPEAFQYWRTPGSSPRKILSTNATVLGVFDKNTGELKLMRQPIKEKLGFNNDIDGGPVIWPQYISANNELVTYLSVEEFLNYYAEIENPTSEVIKIAERVTMDDNPIVVVAKLKD